MSTSYCFISMYLISIHVVIMMFVYLSLLVTEAPAMGLLPDKKMRVAHAPGMPGTFPPPQTSKEAASKRSRNASWYVHDADVPWCMSGSLTRGGGKNVPGIPGACTTRNFAYLVRSPYRLQWSLTGAVVGGTVSAILITAMVITAIVFISYRR